MDRHSERPRDLFVSEGDFTSYLGGRLGLPPLQAENMLGNWLINYEPLRSHDICMSSGPPQAAAASMRNDRPSTLPPPP